MSKSKRKLKPFVVPMMYVLSIAMVITSVYFIERIINSAVFKSENIENVNGDSDGDSSTIENSSDVPVVNT